jgi:hypothetical protein
VLEADDTCHRVKNILHVSVMAVKLSMASAEALSKPTCFSASVMPRRRPALASSAVVGIFGGARAAPSVSGVSRERKDKVRGFLATGNSLVADEARFLGLSVFSMTSELATSAGDMTPARASSL